MGFTNHSDPYQLPASALQNKTVAVDSYIRLYKYLTAIRGRTGDYRRNDDGEPISHLIGMFDFTTALLEHEAKPLFVFEGGIPELKANTLADRADNKQNAQEKYEQAKAEGDEEAMRKWGPRTTSVTDEMVDDCKRMLDTLGVPYIDAATEADPQCAWLATNDICDYAMSTDSDVLLHGAPAILRNWNGEQVDLLPLQPILDDTGLTLDELRQCEILMGCDYNDGAYGVGWVTAQKYVNNSETFDQAILKAKEKDDSIDVERMFEVYEWFKNPDVKEVGVEDIVWGRPKPADARRFLADDKGLTGVSQTFRDFLDV